MIIKVLSILQEILPKDDSSNIKKIASQTLLHEILPFEYMPGLVKCPNLLKEMHVRKYVEDLLSK